MAKTVSKLMGKAGVGDSNFFRKSVSNIETSVAHPDETGKEMKSDWNKATGKTRKEGEAKEAARIAAIPKAKETQGLSDTNSLLKRKGTRSTQKVGRQKLGGRSLLG